MTSEGDQGDPAFESLLSYIKESRGFDFTGYKRASLIRRVKRRMHTVGDETFEAYWDRLQFEPDEFTAVFNTILINVTGFFRDADAWSVLRSDLLPDLLGVKGDAPIRAWSAGCASGEEAYSLAICLAEIMGSDAFRERVKIYATDVDDEALAYARHGSYTDEQLSGLPAGLAEKYFPSSGKQRTFVKDLRRAVIFGRNDLVQDAPISHIDLLVCRNTLMYFDAETQGHILGRLHYALEPGGLLFLGKAELLLSHARILTPVEGMRRFFRRAGRDSSRESTALLGSPPGDPSTDISADDVRMRQEAMMSSPAGQVVVDAAGRLVMSNHRANTLFGLGIRQVGQPFGDLDLSVRPVDLQPLLYQVLHERRTIWVREVEWSRPGLETMWFDVQIVPLAGTERGAAGVTVLFNDVTGPRSLQHELEQARSQLESAYEELQSTNEELETTNEELQSTVEELETTNEELQSTNEELETMNEELQSMNDELGSSNDDLRLRSGQVQELNGFMESILSSLQVAVTVVDADLVVSSWNDPAQQMWGLRADEVVGREFLGLDIGLPVQRLLPPLQQALSGPYDEHCAVVLEAVNRRGRRVRLRITLSPLLNGDEQGSDPAASPEVVGVILVMDEIGAASGGADQNAELSRTVPLP